MAIKSVVIPKEAIASAFQDMRVCGFDLDSIKFDSVQRVLGAPLSKDGVFTAKYVEKIVNEACDLADRLAAMIGGDESFAGSFCF